MWFKNARLYRLEPDWNMNPDQLADLLEQHTHRPLGGLDSTTTGWVEPIEGHGLVHAQDSQYLICLRNEKRLLPASVVNQVARERAKEIEEQQGYRPGRKQMKEIKELVIDDLLPKSHSIHRDTMVWLDMRNRWLCISATNNSVTDEVLGLLSKTLEPFPVVPLHVMQSPASAMTDWLASDEAPVNFSIDQDAELQSTSESRAAVRYVRQTLENEELLRHIQAGKQCTRLAMTWNDRISFVLTDNLDIKRIAPLDIINEGRDVESDSYDRFSSDMMLMTRELALMFSDLVTVLGGEQ